MGDSGDEVYQNLIFGQSTLPDNLFCGDYLYQGYYIDIAYQSNTSDGTGVFTDVFGVMIYFLTLQIRMKKILLSLAITIMYQAHYQ